MPGRHVRRSRARVPALLTVLVLVLVAVAALALRATSGADRAAPPVHERTPAITPSPIPSPTVPPKRTHNPSPGPINTKFAGLTTFRGNATRDYYGEGPVPTHPVIRWRYPSW